MKEQIYTIPVNEAFDKECECPLCELKKTLENESISYALGAAMMEPDYRIESNEKGYCNKHFSMMHDMPNKLGLALILETHIEEIRKKISSYDDKIQKLMPNKKIFFKKTNNNEIIDDFLNQLNKINSDCIICEKINNTMERYIDVVLYLWTNDDSFKQKFQNTKGFCMQHFEQLCSLAKITLKEKDAVKFISELIQKQLSELERLQKETHHFTLKFDYRNHDMDWGTAKDSPLRACEKLGGKF